MKELLELFNQGYKWIARDKIDNELWVYEEKPIKFGLLFGKQTDEKLCVQIDENLFPFITFDNSPFVVCKYNHLTNDLYLKSDDFKAEYNLINSSWFMYKIKNRELNLSTSPTKAIRNGTLNIKKMYEKVLSENQNLIMLHGGRGSNKYSLANVRNNIIKIREEKEMNLIKNNKAYNLNTDLPRVIAYNEVTQLTTLVYNTDKVIRTKPSLKDKNKGDKELGLLIGLLKGLECNDFDAQLGYAYKKYNNKPAQLKVHFRALLGERLPILSHTQLDKLIENVVNGKDVKLVINGIEKDIKVNIKGGK